MPRVDWKSLSIAAAYFGLGVLWILGSDYALAYWASPESLPALQLAKGLFFVSVTSLFLYMILLRVVRQSERGKELLHSQQHAERLRRLYAARTAVNQVILRHGLDRQTLFCDLCRVVVENADLELAWIGVIDPQTQWLDPVAWAGDAWGGRYLERIRVSADPARPEGRGPIGRSILSGHPVVFEHFQEQSDALPWHEAAREAGFSAVAAVPLHQGGELFGALAVYASSAGYFSPDVVELLDQVASDIGFAVENIEREVERQGQEERIRYLAEYDVTTGLLNRHCMAERLHAALLKNRRDRRSVALLLMNLDRFKLVNEAFGQRAGDQILVNVAHRLRAVLGDGALIARQGGDEFLALVTDCDEREALSSLLEQLIAQLTKPLQLEESNHVVTPSVGIAIYPAHGGDVGTLLRNADAAMQAAKGAGRNRYLYFTAEMERSVQQRLELEASLRGVERRDELALWYQPQIDLVSGRLVGVEALLRWRHPVRGLVSPAEFIPIAEESGLIIALGEWVIEEACRQQAVWLEHGFSCGPVAVNVSAVQLNRADLVDFITRCLERHALAPDALQLEMTESLFFRDDPLVRSTLDGLKRAGLHLAVDDFGTGYSNLGYLKRLPLAKLKIDQSFVRDLPGDAEDSVITRTIVNMAHALGLKVIAEGVERLEQFVHLQQLGCDEVQGFLIGRPEPADVFTEQLRAGGWTRDLQAAIQSGKSVEQPEQK